jgi:hypothetical protein
MFIEPANKRQHDGCQQNANEMVNMMVNMMVANDGCQRKLVISIAN